MPDKIMGIDVEKGRVNIIKAAIIPPELKALT
jgi:hypothetical protein